MASILKTEKKRFIHKSSDRDDTKIVKKKIIFDDNIN